MVAGLSHLMTLHWGLGVDIVSKDRSVFQPCWREMGFYVLFASDRRDMLVVLEFDSATGEY